MELKVLKGIQKYINRFKLIYKDFKKFLGIFRAIKCFYGVLAV